MRMSMPVLETHEARGAPLQQDMKCISPDLLLFDQLRSFSHSSKTIPINQWQCTLCYERFPSLAMSANRTICAHCGEGSQESI